MKFAWKSDKAKWLEEMGRPSFEQAMQAIADGELVAVIDNPTKPGHKMFVVVINGYACAVPFEERDGVIWLWTVFPSRKLNEVYGDE